jgi:hypothetical protein
MVDAADLDGDGWIDLVFANGGGYDKGDMLGPAAAGVQEQRRPHRHHRHQRPGVRRRASFNGRAVKIRDIDRDGDNDIMLGVTWQKQSQLFLNSDGQGTFINETDHPPPPARRQHRRPRARRRRRRRRPRHDPRRLGPRRARRRPNITEGGTTLLWLQDGEPASFSDPSSGIFDDATLDNMPLDKVRWSWDLEFVDVDNDWDLDIAISCFACTKQSVLLFANDGAGVFSNVTADNVAQGLGAFDVEADRPQRRQLPRPPHPARRHRRPQPHPHQRHQRRLRRQDRPRVAQAREPRQLRPHGGLPRLQLRRPARHRRRRLQPGKPYPDRLIENQNGVFKQNIFAFNAATPGTYALVLADFNKDRILDVAQAQNENAFDKKVFIGSNVDLLPDTAAPIFNNYQKLADNIEFGIDHTLHARVHDNKSPLMLHDFQSPADGPNGRPYVESWGDDPGDPEMNPGDLSAPGEWYGEYLWRITFNVPKDVVTFYYRLCAIDAAGNKYCTPVESVDNPDDSTTTTSDSDPTTTTSDTTVDPTTNATSDGGGDCNNDGVCQDNEKDEECGDCCDNDGICEPPNEQEPWCNDCSPPTPTTGVRPDHRQRRRRHQHHHRQRRPARRRRLRLRRRRVPDPGRARLAGPPRPARHPPPPPPELSAHPSPSESHEGPRRTGVGPFVVVRPHLRSPLASTPADPQRNTFPGPAPRRAIKPPRVGARAPLQPACTPLRSLL